jgi:hypothetical protein
MRTTGTYQHTHMCQRLLQGILLERSWPHGAGKKMQVLIDSRNAGSPILCPWSDSRVLRRSNRRANRGRGRNDRRVRLSAANDVATSGGHRGSRGRDGGGRRDGSGGAAVLRVGARDGSQSQGELHGAWWILLDLTC